MSDFIAIENIQEVLSARLLPTITVWNRLEGRPRAKNFNRSLKAEVRDALWMLTRQWQIGEFQGDDAGSPATAKIHISTSQLHKYQAGAKTVQSFERNVPLETKVEQRPIRLSQESLKMMLDLRLMMGRRWMKLIRAFSPQIKDQYRDRYGFSQPDPSLREDAPICAHREVWQSFAAVAGRGMDGGALYLYLQEDENHTAHDGITDLNPSEQANIEAIQLQFLNWFQSFFYQPSDPNQQAWLDSHLEYQFHVAAPYKGEEKVMVAEEYYQGHLDWYNLDLDPRQEILKNEDAENQDDSEENGSGSENSGESSESNDNELDEDIGTEELEGTVTLSFMPTPLLFDGMPNSRWWEFEDRRTNFGDIKPDTTDLNKLLLLEFGLVYADDWFVVPVDLPVGSVAQVEGLSVTNVFGERTWIEASGRGDDEDWQRWNMFSLNIRGNDRTSADTSLLLLPTMEKIQESEPTEEIYLIRDEIANMVWGIEKKAPLADGNSRSGLEAARELSNHYHRILEEELGSEALEQDSIEYRANIRYQIMTSVPEHWIPFIPVHMENDNREVQLQRAAMLRLIEGDPNPPEKIRPRTILMRKGLDEAPRKAYFIYEEEVSRAGTRLIQSFQRTRWHNGKVFNWLGIRKLTGRGEGSSGLAFDQIPSTRRRRQQ